MKENISEEGLEHFDELFQKRESSAEDSHGVLQGEKAPVPERFFLAALSAFPSLGHTDRDCKHHRYCYQPG